MGDVSTLSFATSLVSGLLQVVSYISRLLYSVAVPMQKLCPESDLQSTPAVVSAPRTLAKNLLSDHTIL